MLVIVSIITAAFAPIIIQYYYDKSKKENKEHLQRIAIFSVYGGILFTLVLNAAGVPIEERISSLFDSSSSSPCNCEEELYIWASGGNTFNTTLKVDCLEKYNGPDYMHVYHKMDGVTNNITFMKAWDKAKKECESN